MKLISNILFLFLFVFVSAAQDSKGKSFGPTRVLEFKKVKMTSTNEIVCFGTGVDDNYIPDLPYMDRNAYQLFAEECDTSGNLLWYKNYGEKNNIDEGVDISEAIDGGFLLLGITGEYLPTHPHYPKNIHLIKTDKFGNIEWQKYFEGYPSSVFQLPNGNIYLLGSIENGKMWRDRFLDYDLQIRILSKKGELINSKNIPNTHSPFADAGGLMSSFKMSETKNSTLSFITKICPESVEDSLNRIKTINENFGFGSLENFNYWLVKMDRNLNEISRIKIDSLKSILDYWVKSDILYIQTDTKIISFYDTKGKIIANKTVDHKPEKSNDYRVQSISPLSKNFFYYNNNNFDLHIQIIDPTNQPEKSFIYHRDDLIIGSTFATEDKINYYFISDTDRKLDANPSNWGDQLCLFKCRK